MQGLLDFLLSGNSEAAALRDLAEFYVYPMVNPDGRYRGTGRGNPELTSLGYSDHNRVWDKTGISTIDVFTSAMKEDTGGSADYFFDFHDQASSETLLVSSDMKYSPFCSVLENYNEILSDVSDGISVVTNEGETGMARLWATSSSGLNATYAYTPEFTHWNSADYYQGLGEFYGLALYDTLIPEPTALTLFLLGSFLWRRRHYGEKNQSV